MISKGLIYVSIKSTQTYLQKSITWPKALGKRRYEWVKACVITSLKAYKIEHTNQDKVKCKLLVMVSFSLLLV
jgi:hypothetical protein